MKKERVTVTSTVNSNGTDIISTALNNNNNVRSGPRQQGEGCEEKEQAIVLAQRLRSTTPVYSSSSSSRYTNTTTNNNNQHHQSLSPLTVAIRITLLAAGFIIGPSGTTIRQLCATTGCTISSATTPPDEICSRPTRTFTIIAFDDDGSHSSDDMNTNTNTNTDTNMRSIKSTTIDGIAMNKHKTKKDTTATATASHQSMYKALSIICNAVDRYKELCEGSNVGKFVERIQPVDGIDFLYQPPPHHIMPQAARIAVKDQQQITNGGKNDDDGEDANDASSELQMCMLSPAEEKIEKEAVLSTLFGLDHHTKYATHYQHEKEAMNNKQPAVVGNATPTTQPTRGYSNNPQQQHSSVFLSTTTKIASNDVGSDPVVTYNPPERHDNNHNQHHYSYPPSPSSTASLSSLYQRSHSYGGEHSLAASSPSLSRSASLHFYSALSNNTGQQQEQQQQSRHWSPFSKFVTANVEPFGSTATPSVAAAAVPHMGMEGGQYVSGDDGNLTSQLQAAVKALHAQQQQHQQGNYTPSFSSAASSDSPFLSTPGGNYRNTHHHHQDHQDHHNIIQHQQQQQFKVNSNPTNTPAYSFNYFNFNSPKTPATFSPSTTSSTPPPPPLPSTAAIQRGAYRYHSSPATAPPPPPPPPPLTTASSSSSSSYTNYQLFDSSPPLSLTPPLSSYSSASPNMNMNISSYDAEVARRGNATACSHQPSRFSQSTIPTSFTITTNDSSKSYSNPFEMPLPIDVGLLYAINTALEAIGKVQQYQRAAAITTGDNGSGDDLFTGVQDGLLSLMSQNLLNNERFGL